MRLFFTASLLIGGLGYVPNAAAQATEELLHAKTVKHFLVFRADPRNRTLGYFIDGDEESRNIKQIRGKTCFAVAEKAEEKQVRLELAYLNPFKYKISVSNTSLTDPSYEAVSRFLSVVQGLSGQLAAGGATGGVALPAVSKEMNSTEIFSKEQNTFIRKYAANEIAVNAATKVPANQRAQVTKAKSASLITNPTEELLAKESKMKAALVNAAELNDISRSKRFGALAEITAPSLSSWVYQVQLNPARKRWLESGSPDTTQARALLEGLSHSSRRYYQQDADSANFVRKVKNALDAIAAANSFEMLQQQHITYKRNVAKLKHFNATSLATLNSFVDEQKRRLPGERLNDTSAIAAFHNFSRQVFADYAAQATAIQAKRELVVQTLDSLGKELDDIELELSGKRTSYLLTTLFLTEDKMHDVTITVQPRTIGLTKEGSILVEEGKNIISEQLRLRASKKLIPEFGNGVYYTNLEYSRFGTRTVGSDTFVEEAAPTKVKAVLAAHLNLVLNTWDGLIHPLVQVGVGTGKDVPCLLAGGGLRFTQPKRLALTGGVIWNWQRDLSELKVGDKVTGTAALENDLHLKLKTTPSMYIGVQYNF